MNIHEEALRRWIAGSSVPARDVAEALLAVGGIDLAAIMVGGPELVDGRP